MKYLFKGAFVLILFQFFSISSYAFNDEVGAEIPLILEATRQVMKGSGISKDNEAKGKIVSNWIHDEVVRSRGLFRGFTKRRMKRRYRMHVTVKKGRVANELRTNIQMQEKSAGNNPSIVWQNAKLSSEDYILEREYFHKILEQLGRNLAGNHTPELS